MIDSQYYEAQCYLRGTSLAAAYHYTNGAKSDYTYYAQNAHGDVVNLTDADGAVTKTYHYDAFGVEIDLDTGDVNAFRFCGEYFDTESGTLYLRARYYQASIGRFTQRDSLTGKIGDPLSLNLYTYCHNNPVYYFDPSGHKSWCKTWEEFGSQVSEINYNLKRTSKIVFPSWLNDSKNAENKVQRFTSGFAYSNSTGGSVAIGFGNFTGSFAFGTGIHANGDFFTQYSVGYGTSVNFAEELESNNGNSLFQEANLSIFNSTQYVSNYDNISGYGLSTGVLVGGLPESGNFIVGLDADWAEKPGKSEFYKPGINLISLFDNYSLTGYTKSLSVGTPTFEIHETKTATIAEKSGNVYTSYYKVCDRLINHFNNLV